ncbi:MAG: Lipopolysaccharide core heptosyltransferase RfaQ [Chlamydiae bacterium]|nr:Lipopolysaccharide core heptosyltransferase RfaQ [Chlamydiota bacterium]
MSWKNWFIKGLLWFFNPKETRSRHCSTPNRFLIVSTTGLGDTLWGTPAIRALRQSFPDSSINILTSPIGAQVLEHNPHIDDIFIYSSFFSLVRYFLPLKRKQCDAVLIFHTSQRIVLPYCALLETPQIIGTEGINKDLDFLLTKSLKKTYQHEIARRLSIVQEVGAHVTDYSLEMIVRKQEEDAVKHFLGGHGVPDHIPLVGLHPGAKDTFKQWPAECFIEVGKRLTQHLGCQILVSGDQSEALLILEIASKIPGAIPIAGELRLSTFGALLKKMAVFITNDTGPMHMAFAANTPTVAIFGPTDPNLCGPFHVKNARVLSARKTCTPCLKKRCDEPFCLLEVGPTTVYEAALSSAYRLAFL